METIGDSIKAVNADFYGPLMKNIYLVGGTAQMRGFRERVEVELRKDCDAYISPRVSLLHDNDAAYKALLDISQAKWFEDVCMSKSLYNELGFSRLAALI